MLKLFCLNLPGKSILLFADCFAEHFDTNCTFFFVPSTHKIATSIEVVQKGLHKNDLSNIQVAVLALGHNDIRTLLGGFMTDYKRIIKALQEHNPNMVIICTSILPLGPDEESSWHFAYVKTTNIINQITKKPNVSYYNSFESLQVGRVVPPDYQRNGKLVGAGASLFISGLSRYLCGHAAIQM